jgi:ammonium transporter, Amt family
MAIDAGDTAWVLITGALVMLMTPALGFFYGGLVRQKNILTLLIQCYAIFAAVSIIWALLGYSLAFGETSGHFIGDSHFFALRHVDATPYIDAPTVPGIAFFFFQLAACAITPALVVGAPAERFHTLPACLFSCIWVLLVYCPIAHWVFHEEGWLKRLGTKDFAGGMVVHMSAGYSALAVAFVVGPKRDSPDKQASKANISYSVLGGALLWFGWFGYNGGAAFAANWQAALAIVSTNLSASAAGLSWGIVDYIYTKKVSALGIVTGSVVGLIAMTPGCGFCPAWSSLIIGFLAGIFSNLVIRLRETYHWFDDTLDVFGCHGICGTWGVFATGLFASADTPGKVNGAFFGRGEMLGYQLAGIVTVALWSFILTLIIILPMKFAGILRVDSKGEDEGLDLYAHGETAYVVVPQLAITPTM